MRWSKKDIGREFSIPRVPGHEIAGRIDALGADVTLWKPGQRVGVGWHGGHCFQCDPCRRGDFVNCQFEKITAITLTAAMQEYVVVPAEAVAAMPDDLPAAEAAPLLCAGITVFNALRNSGARAGDLVAVQGIGGLGPSWNSICAPDGLSHRRHRPRRRQRSRWPRKLGAHEYIDTSAGDPAAALQKLGGAQRDPRDRAGFEIDFCSGGWSRRQRHVAGRGCQLLTRSPSRPSNSSTAARRLQGWASGTGKRFRGHAQFSSLSGVRPMIEKYPLEKAAEAYQQMISGKARFRVVLTMT